MVKETVDRILGHGRDIPEQQTLLAAPVDYLLNVNIGTGCSLNLLYGEKYNWKDRYVTLTVLVRLCSFV